MRILLDECGVPETVRRAITGHQVSTVKEMGWAGTKNGDLLNIAEHDFDVLLTVDRNIEYQQNLRDRRIALVILMALNKLRTLRPLIPRFLLSLETVKPGQIVRVEQETPS